MWRGEADEAFINNFPSDGLGKNVIFGMGVQLRNSKRRISVINGIRIACASVGGGFKRIISGGINNIPIGIGAAHGLVIKVPLQAVARQSSQGVATRQNEGVAGNGYIVITLCSEAPVHPLVSVSCSQ